MFPADTKKASLGSPRIVMLFSSFQSGWAIIPTLYPYASKSLVIIDMPNEGWSTYASPHIYTKSHCFHPLFFISSLQTGKKSILYFLIFLKFYQLSGFLKNSYTFLAASAFIFSTAVSSSTDASFMASIDLKCLIRLFRLAGPIPSISSRIE